MALSFGSFLRGFLTVLHAVETAAKIAAPIISTVDPVIGALMTQANNAAIGIESASLTMSTTIPGDEKAAIVAAQSQATIDVINSILVSQNKPKLPDNTNTIVQATVKTVVSGLKAVAQAVEPQSTPTQVPTVTK